MRALVSLFVVFVITLVIGQVYGTLDPSATVNIPPAIKQILDYLHYLSGLMSDYLSHWLHPALDSLRDFYDRHIYRHLEPILRF